MNNERICPVCGKSFTYIKESKIYCSPECGYKGRRESRKRAGLCTICGKNPAMPGKTYGEVCSENKAGYYRTWKKAGADEGKYRCRIPAACAYADGRCCAGCSKLGCKDRCRNSPEKCGMTEE